MDVAADALEIAGLTRREAVAYEGLLSSYLPEWPFRGRENRKIRFAILTSAAFRGGLEADLFDEVMWWHTNDYWQYALLAAVALIRATADRKGVSVSEFAQQLARHRGIDLPPHASPLPKGARQAEPSPGRLILEPRATASLLGENVGTTSRRHDPFTRRTKSSVVGPKASSRERRVRPNPAPETWRIRRMGQSLSPSRSVTR
jgi:hypothetical protein